MQRTPPPPSRVSGRTRDRVSRNFVARSVANDRLAQVKNGKAGDESSLGRPFFGYFAPAQRRPYWENFSGGETGPNGPRVCKAGRKCGYTCRYVSFLSPGIGFLSTALLEVDVSQVGRFVGITFPPPGSVLPARGSSSSICSRRSPAPRSNSPRDNSNRRTCRCGCRAGLLVYLSMTARRSPRV